MVGSLRAKVKSKFVLLTHDWGRGSFGATTLSRRPEDVRAKRTYVVVKVHSLPNFRHCEH